MAVDLTANCRLFLKFNEEVWGAVVDDSVSETDGVAHGGLAPASGKIGNCAPFEGDDAKYITVTEIADSLSFGEDTDFAISLWFKTLYEGENTIFILSKKPYQGLGYSAQLRGDDYKFSFNLKAPGRSNSAISIAAVNDGDWHHVICNYDRSDKITLYLDNVYQDDANISEFLDIDNEEDLYLGRRSREVEPLSFAGDLDCLMIFDKILSVDEREYLYNNGNGVESLVEGEAPGPSDLLLIGRSGTCRGVLRGANRGVL